MCECILGWGSVAYHNWVTVTLNLTSDLISRTALCLVHISYILLDRYSKLVTKCILRWWNVTHTISGHCYLDLWPSFKKSLCLEHISYILWGRNSKFGDYMHLGMVESHILFSGHCDLDLWPSFSNNCVRSISLILFEKGIQNLVYECILGWLSVLYHLRVTMTLTSDLVLIIIVSGAYLFYYLR